MYVICERFIESLNHCTYITLPGEDLKRKLIKKLRRLNQQLYKFRVSSMLAEDRQNFALNLINFTISL